MKTWRYRRTSERPASVSVPDQNPIVDVELGPVLLRMKYPDYPGGFRHTGIYDEIEILRYLEQETRRMIAALPHSSGSEQTPDHAWSDSAVRVRNILEAIDRERAGEAGFVRGRKEQSA